MATDSHVKSVTNTLTSTTADEITLTQLWPVVRITNHDVSNWLYARQDGVAVAEANGTTAIAPGTTRAVKGERAEGTNTIVMSVVGDGNMYTVEGVNGGDINIAELEADVDALQNGNPAPFLARSIVDSGTPNAGVINPGANVAEFVPIMIGNDRTPLNRILFRIGVSSGNIDVGIFDDDDGGAPGTLLVSSGSVACPAAGGAAVAFDLWTPPASGRYYAAFAVDNVTVTFSYAANLNNVIGFMPVRYSKGSLFPLATTSGGVADTTGNIFEIRAGRA